MPATYQNRKPLRVGQFAVSFFLVCGFKEIQEQLDRVSHIGLLIGNQADLVNLMPDGLEAAPNSEGEMREVTLASTTSFDLFVPSGTE